MEENDFLQDLLECSVCLEAMTEKNHVLPCQHTFCKKCLTEILQTQNEIRCPECRILYKEITSLDELPSNILLIRLLEGLKQNMRTKNNRPSKMANQTPVKQYGKLSIHQQPVNFVQRQLMNSKSVLQQLSANVLPSNSFIKSQPSYVSSRQLLVSGLNANTNGHSMVYGNVPQLPTNQQYPVIQQQSNRAHLNLDNTLVKPLETTTNVSNSIQQNVSKHLVKTPINIPSTTNSLGSNNISSNSSNSLASPNVNNLNVTSINQPHQSINKSIMANARALRDSTDCGIWSIKKNDILFIKKQLNAYWYLAVFNGIQGVVPISFVELLPNTSSLMNNTNNLNNSYSTLPSSINSITYQSMANNVNSNVHNVNRHQPTASNVFQQAQSIGVQLPLPQHYFSQFTMCRALYDFRVADVNDKSCLTFRKNDLITLIRRVDENWLEGSLDNNIGIFPLTFVEFLPTIRPATRSSSQNSGSSSTPLPTPPIYHRTQSTSNSTGNSRLINISHSRSNSISIVNGNTIPSNVHTSNSVQQSMHQCNSTNEMITNPKLTLNQDINSSIQFGNVEASNPLSGSSSSNSYNNLLDIKSNQSHANLYIALYNYQPQKKDELQLKKNELYVVNEKYLDGWYKGSSVKTNAVGLFPANYLLPARNNGNNSQSSYQNVIANRRSFGNLSTAKFDSADNLLGTTNEFNNATNSNLTKPKQLTSSIDNNLSDLNSTMNKMNLNAKSENHLNGQQSNGAHSKSGQISKSVEQLNNNNSTYENLMNRRKEDDSKDSSASNSPQWIQPKVAATRSSSKQKNLQNSSVKSTSQLELPYSSFVLNNSDFSNELRIEITTDSNNTTHVIKEVVNTPIKKEEKKSVLIKMFTGKRSGKMDKHKKFSACDNPTFVDISPKN